MAPFSEKSSLIRPASRRPYGSLYFLTMDEAPLDHLQQIEAACEAGIRWIQLRMKQAGPEEFLNIARAAKKICDAADCALIINDRVEIAARVKAHGVQLGKYDMSPGEARQLLGDDFIIGATANTAEDIREHYRAGADYVGLGPYRFTTTKKNLSPILGLEGYRQIMDQLRREQIELPVFAIGGIGKEDIAGLLQTGVQGIAFSGLLVHAGDRVATVRGLKEEIQKIRGAGIL
jgi:thiamine-phosphate pyrophosphorylase